MPEKRLQKLCSGGSESLQLPIQFQLTDDGRFMSKLKHNQQTSANSDLVSETNSDPD